MVTAVRFAQIVVISTLPFLTLGAVAEKEEAKDAAAANFTFEDHVKPLVELYCIECHNADRLKGDLNLERFKTNDMILDSIALWQRIGLRVKNGEMPPKDKFQPTAEEKEKLVTWVESLSLDNTDCNRIANEESVKWFPGYVMSRRLNREEYENTLRGLLGTEVEVAHLFPADGAGGEGFNNHGSALFLSSIQMEKYLEAADLAVETALPARTPGEEARFAARTLSDAGGEQCAKDPVRDLLITARPGNGVSPREAARHTIRDFTTRAWRRPVTDDEVDRLLKLFDQAYERGDGYEGALKLAFKGALVSPHFIFLAEPEPADAGVYELGDYPLASRLSYFLWGTMPDEELFTLAEMGELHKPEELKRQVHRMLRDAKANGLGEIFATQWLSITGLGETVKPDANIFPEFNDDLAKSMRAEAVHFFNQLIREDRSLLELLDADYTYVDEGLAKHYGIEGVTGDDMQKVVFEDPNRGGVLSMAAILTTTSHATRTSPVLRGKWVLEQILGDRVPPPPPDAGTLSEEHEGEEPKTLRARLELHREKAECASCHDRMDPIGFGLQNFDAVGRWRNDHNGLPIDSSGVLPSGEEFSGPKELKAILLARKDAFARNLSRKMLGYALGRSLNRYDQCVIDDSLKALSENEYRPTALITEIVLSYPFRHRYSGGQS